MPEKLGKKKSSDEGSSVDENNTKKKKEYHMLDVTKGVAQLSSVLDMGEFTRLLYAKIINKTKTISD